MLRSPPLIAVLGLLINVLCPILFIDAFTLCSHSSRFLHNKRQRQPTKLKDTQSTTETIDKNKLLTLLSNVPPNEPTPKDLTEQILQAVKDLEETCPTPEQDVLQAVAGNWELLWTAQDVSSLPQQRINLRSWVNPLENQSYSNNAQGRSNPIFPQTIQDSLEEIGILSERKQSDNTIISTQAIDLKRGRVRNVVAVEVRNPTPIFSKNGISKGFITVDVSATPNATDARKIDVKFDRCKVAIQDSPINLDFGLGIIGPSGWLRTVFVDDDIRITRGHKGSVFILSRTGGKRSS